MRHLASRAAVLALVAYALSGVYAAATPLWQTPGTLGFVTDYGATVRAVTPGGPAAQAGIAAGERIRLSAAPFDVRRYLSGPGTSVPIGAVVDVPLERDGALRNVRLTAVAAATSAADRTALLFVLISALVFIAVGASLIVLRPSWATWGFGLYCLLALPTAMDLAPMSSAQSAFALTAFYDVIQNFGVAGLVLFALEFPRPFRVPWRERIRRALPLIVVVLAALTLYPDIANQILGRAAQLENRVLQATFGAVFALAMAILWDTYRRVAPEERERLRWVLIGFSCGLFASYVGTTLIFSTALAAAPPLWLSLALTSLNVLLPITVAHAVVRHRVLDIQFVIGRALVFAVLTTILAAIFALLDYVFGTVLEDFRISRVIGAAISLTIAFTFKRLEERATATIEAIFFRKRRAAEARLSAAALLLPHARSAAAVEETLVGTVVDAFGLASAAMYRRDAAGSFARAASAGWDGAECTSLDDGDLLVLALRAESRYVDLAAFVWKRTDIPRDGRAPAVAVPIRLRDDLAAFTLYGAHADGGALEPSELALFERLAYSAGLAFDQIEARGLRDENERQRALIGDLSARLDELRHQSP